MIRKNDIVSHSRFGNGTVLDVREEKAHIMFDGASEGRWIASSFLELVAEGERETPSTVTARYEGPLLMSKIFRFADRPVSETRSYQVDKWMRGRCPDNCEEYQTEGRCGHQRPFPIPFLVRLMLDEGGEVVRASCSQGRKGEKGACEQDGQDDGCDHVRRALLHLAGEEPDDKSDLRRYSCDFRMITRAAVTMPTCPNCRSRAFVKRDGDKFVCTSGTCMRQDRLGIERPYRFAPGDGKLPPRWRSMPIREGWKWR